MKQTIQQNSSLPSLKKEGRSHVVCPIWQAFCHLSPLSGSITNNSYRVLWACWAAVGCFTLSGKSSGTKISIPPSFTLIMGVSILSPHGCEPPISVHCFDFDGKIYRIEWPTASVLSGWSLQPSTSCDYERRSLVRRSLSKHPRARVKKRILPLWVCLGAKWRHLGNNACVTDSSLLPLIGVTLGE